MKTSHAITAISRELKASGTNAQSAPTLTSAKNARLLSSILTLSWKSKPQSKLQSRYLQWSAMRKSQCLNAPKDLRTTHHHLWIRFFIKDSTSWRDSSTVKAKSSWEKNARPSRRNGRKRHTSGATTSTPAKRRRRRRKKRRKNLKLNPKLRRSRRFRWKSNSPFNSSRMRSTKTQGILPKCSVSRQKNACLGPEDIRIWTRKSFWPFASLSLSSTTEMIPDLLWWRATYQHFHIFTFIRLKIQGREHAFEISFQPAT